MDFIWWLHLYRYRVASSFWMVWRTSLNRFSSHRRDVSKVTKRSRLAVQHFFFATSREFTNTIKGSTWVYQTRWWFQTFFIFTPTWGNDPIWRAYFSNGFVQPPTSRVLRDFQVFISVNWICSWRIWLQVLKDQTSGWFTIVDQFGTTYAKEVPNLCLALKEVFVCLFVCLFVCWFVGLLVCWFVCWLVGWLAGRLFVCCCCCCCCCCWCCLFLLLLLLLFFLLLLLLLLLLWLWLWLWLLCWGCGRGCDCGWGCGCGCWVVEVVFVVVLFCEK